jgi:serine/threonine protein phosphatase PrpC
MGCSSSNLVAAEPAAEADGTSATGKAHLARLARPSSVAVVTSWPSVAPGTPAEEAAAGTISSAGLRGAWASLSQRGFYPNAPGKPNQDTCVVAAGLASGDAHLFAVFDGHGEFGTECAQFAKVALLRELVDAGNALATAPAATLRAGLLAANAALRAAPVDDSLSGTTACAALLVGRRLWVANVGDSRAVLALRSGAHRDLSLDQTPFRADEAARVTAAGARVLTLDQVEGVKDAGAPCWTDEAACDGDPPRLWAPGGTYPGTAFTRSIGDALAEAIGVCADPEITSVDLEPGEHAALIVATDGVWEFLPSAAAVALTAGAAGAPGGAGPALAARALVSAGYKAWLQRETRTDDITAIVVLLSEEAAEAEAEGVSEAEAGAGA